MRPESNATAPPAAYVNPGGVWRWNSPLPYLFGGLSFMLGLIAVALILLACSFRKDASQVECEEKSAGKQVELEVASAPKVVVIMAGDDNPTYLATPVSCSRCQCHSAAEEQFQSDSILV